MFNPDRQSTLLPVSAVGHNNDSDPDGSHADLFRRNTVKELPGQTNDPKDPLNRHMSTLRAAREGITRRGTHRSGMTSMSSSNAPFYSSSISARRNQLYRQNAFGEPPNQFMLYYYALKEWTNSPDSSDEKTTSTLLNVLNVFIDFSLCVLYLIEASSLTRPPGHESHWLYIDRSESLWRVLVVIATYNLLTVILSIIFSEAKSVSIRSIRHIISTLVALPFVISVFIPNGHRLYVPYFLQSIALISRVQQALNFYIDIGVSDLPMDPLKSKTIVFAMYILTLVYCAISAFQIVEYDQLEQTNDHNNLLKLLYFTLITASTVGYGDVTPKNQLGYAVVILIILAVLTVFPWMISGIMDALAQAKAGEGIFKAGGNKFMIISGSLHSAPKLANVLNGFWFTNKEYSNAKFKIVIFGLKEPSKEVQALLQSARYKNRVVYLKGSPLESKDLDRIQARHAEGIFIIADRNSSFSPQEEDRHNTLSTLAFRNVSDAGIYTYNLLPETEIYQKLAATQVVCADELRQVLLAFNCLQQATATLILNLLHQHKPSENFSEVWEAEYDDSLGNEFYISYLNPIFDGKPFGFVSWFLYRRFQVILFGVRIRLKSGEYHTALNPGKDYRFKHNEQCIFIAQNPTDLDEVNELTKTNLDNFLQHLKETQEEDVNEIGPDYHAKNFTKALQTLGSKTACASTAKKSRSTQRGVHDDHGLYSRKSGRYQLHFTMPTIANEDDEIEVVPEVSLLSGPEDGEQDTPLMNDMLSPKSSSYQESFHAAQSKNIPSPRFKLDKSSELEALFSRPMPKKGTKAIIPDLDPSFSRIDHPVAPYAGAKVPLCVLVDTSKGVERKLSDLVIDRWSDVLAQREAHAKQMEMEQELDGEQTARSYASVASTPTSSGFKLGQSAIANSNTIPRYSEAGGHVLICSPNYDIFRLICTLRSAHLKQFLDIVVLCPRQPTTQEFKVLRCFPRLYFIIGDCLSREDLERGSITTSSKYLFMRHPDKAGVDGTFFDSAAVINRILVQQIFSDAQIARIGKLGSDQKGPFTTTTTTTTSTIASSSHNTMFSSLDDSTLAPLMAGGTVSLHELCEGPQCVYELVEERSVEFLQIRKTEIRVAPSGAHNNSTPSLFLNGVGGPLGQLDDDFQSLGYQGYTNDMPAMGGTRRKTAADAGTSDFYHNPIYASGGVLVGGLLDNCLYQLYSNPSVLTIITLLCGIRTKADVKRDYHLFKHRGAGCRLECIPVPEGFGVKTISKSGAHHQTVYDEPVSTVLSESINEEVESGTESLSDGEADDDEEQPLEPEASGSQRKKKSKNARPSFRGAFKGKNRFADLFDRARRGGSGGGGNDSSDSSLDSDYMFDNRHKNFLHLYEHLALDQGVIPIGLLRLQGDDPKTVHLGIGGSSRCYAISNPLLDTVVLDTDMVFVLTR
ncbi:potassium channel, sub T, member 2 [Podila epigama]|nr:potassium channel, sub T, member 2 [Podila epigama]